MLIDDIDDVDDIDIDIDNCDGGCEGGSNRGKISTAFKLEGPTYDEATDSQSLQTNERDDNLDGDVEEQEEEEEDDDEEEEEEEEEDG
jgi:hypothetical protein